MIPARTKDSHTADPATSPAEPSSEKIPAPTIEATPMKAAWRVETRGRAAAGSVMVRRLHRRATPRHHPERATVRPMWVTTPRPAGGVMRQTAEAAAGD